MCKANSQTFFRSYDEYRKSDLEFIDKENLKNQEISRQDELLKALGILYAFDTSVADFTDLGR
ncbi:MAG: hypothetical protein GX160_04980 [Clostridiales bacterium]|nr:hypothetical protein [Clostridiales bacterium]